MTLDLGNEELQKLMYNNQEILLGISNIQWCDTVID
jgi:hypothetical protein